MRPAGLTCQFSGAIGEYAVTYAIEDDTIYAIMHMKRKPDYREDGNIAKFTC